MIYLMRHTESTLDVENRLQCKHLQGELTTSGEEQAQNAATWLADKAITKIYHSPFHHAEQSAQIIAHKLTLSAMALDGLRGIDCGELEGRDDNYSWGRWQQIYERWRQAERDAAFPGGESFGEAFGRFSGVLMQVAAEVASGEQVLLVTHGELILSIVPYLCVNAAALQRVDPVNHGGFVVLAPFDPGRYICEAWNIVEHLV